MKSLRSGALGGSALAAAAALAASGVAVLALSAYRKQRMQLDNKVVLITGGSRGLGLAMAEEFGRLGCKLVLAARDAEELNRAKDLLVRRLSSEPSNVLTVPSDLRQPEEANTLIEAATEHFGRIDILVNNAGTITVGPVEQQTSDAFHDVMNSNLFSAVHCSLAVLPQMQVRGDGIIVNIASIGGKIAVPHMLPYTASKFAMVGFSQGLHAELRSKGIHVVTVCPGLMRTGSPVNALFSGDAEREYRWFSLLASMPGVAVSAQYAARRIVRAVQRKEIEIAISPQAVLVSRLAPVMPGLTAQAICVANHLLPTPAPGGEAISKGSKVRGRELQPAATLGIAAAQRYNGI